MNLPPGLRGEAGALRRRALRRAGLALAGAVVLGVLLLAYGERQPRPSAVASALPVAPDPERVQTPVADTKVVPDETSGLGAVVERLVDSPAPVQADASTAIAPAVPVAGVLLPLAAVQPGGEGIYLQLGVFGDVSNALAVYERLAEAGMEARIQSRVVVGPFADRRAAERAQAALRKAGEPEGILVPPRSR
ncbi:MAG TPA: SPOR domain-containing protein [Thauera sp.]|nr:SPOR domain-containing protein [Thauera sp.]